MGIDIWDIPRFRDAIEVISAFDDMKENIIMLDLIDAAHIVPANPTVGLSRSRFIDFRH